MIDPSSFSNITGQIDYGADMPVNQKIMNNMIKQYGAEKGKQVYYASVNKGTIKEAGYGYDDDAIQRTVKMREQQQRRARRGKR